MFIDEVRIRVKAGDGGNGCLAFRREKYVPRGGPSGGDGGRGGDITMVASVHYNTLLHFRFNPEHTAQRGRHGEGSNRSGREGESIELAVPVGTIVYDADSGELLHDFTMRGDRFLVAKGGRGGRGNQHFATSTHQAPTEHEPGHPGEAKYLRLELKLLADVGLVGFPNAGKSTLISRISAARPKIADYPFTTIEPNLGVVSVDDSTFVVADIPGLIEGAHLGHGLGVQFLRHIERTRLLVHLVDVSENQRARSGGGLPRGNGGAGGFQRRPAQETHVCGGVEDRRRARIQSESRACGRWPRAKNCPSLRYPASPARESKHSKRAMAQEICKPAEEIVKQLDNRGQGFHA